MNRFELTRFPAFKASLRSRWPQFLIRAAALGGFGLVILAGLLGTPVGSRNFGIVFVWIAWWALLMLVAVPFFGRAWCGICPIPMPGEWLQQGGVVTSGRKGLGLARRWPNKLRNIWLQNGAFVLVALFSTVVLTQPRISALALAGFLLVAVASSLVFERRAFCRFLCPVGGFIGLYSQLAPLEVRVKDPAACARHTEKSCYTGSSEGYGCPWQVYPPGLVKNTYCGMCMECLRTCPHDNIAVGLRMFGQDLEKPQGRRLDEVYKAFIMLGSALVYSAVLLGPWGWLKSAAYSIGSLPWLAYVMAFLGLILGGLPGLFWVAVSLGNRLAGCRSQARKDLIHLGYALVPLGLGAWIAFSLSFVFVNLSYLLPSLSDPFGWGWNMFGTAGLAWAPYLTRLLPGIQALVLAGSLAWACRTALLISRENVPAQAALRRAIPVMAYCLALTAGLVGLLIA